MFRPSRCCFDPGSVVKKAVVTVHWGQEIWNSVRGISTLLYKFGKNILFLEVLISPWGNDFITKAVAEGTDLMFIGCSPRNRSVLCFSEVWESDNLPKVSLWVFCTIQQTRPSWIGSTMDTSLREILSPASSFTFLPLSLSHTFSFSPLSYTHTHFLSLSRGFRECLRAVFFFFIRT